MCRLAFLPNRMAVMREVKINKVADTRSQNGCVLHMGHSYLLQRQTVNKLITPYH